MKKLRTNLKCPNCHGDMLPMAMGCHDCELKIEGVFIPNEFASLDEDNLHFLRIFIHSEGKIREMEAALGVSYPTIKTRLAKLKTKLFGVSYDTPGPPETPDANPEWDATKNPGSQNCGEVDPQGSRPQDVIDEKKVGINQENAAMDEEKDALSPQKVLKKLENGEIDFVQARQFLQNRAKGAGHEG